MTIERLTTSDFMARYPQCPNRLMRELSAACACGSMKMRPAALRDVGQNIPSRSPFTGGRGIVPPAPLFQHSDTSAVLSARGTDPGTLRLPCGWRSHGAEGPRV